MKRLAVFAGQGTQAAGMAAPYLPNAGFTRTVDACSTAYAAHDTTGRGWNLRAAMDTCDGVDDTVIGQPLLSALQIGLVHGQHFDYVVGHSLGEIAAAQKAGYLTTEEAMGVIYYRSLALRNALGEMAVALCPADKALAILSEEGLLEDVSIAAANDARSTTLCGKNLADARAKLKAKRVVTKAVPVKYAFHSPIITPEDIAALEENLRTKVFTRSPDEVAEHRAAVASDAGGSTVFYPTGMLPQAAVCAPDALDAYQRALPSFSAYSPAYWAMQIRNPVAFALATRAVAAACAPADPKEACTAVEVSPTPVLTKFVGQTFTVEELALKA